MGILFQWLEIISGKNSQIQILNACETVISPNILIRISKHEEILGYGSNRMCNSVAQNTNL